MEHDLIKDTAERAFNISPDTVFGFLVGLLVLAVIFLARQWTKNSNRLLELQVDTVKTMKELALSNSLLQEELVRLRSEMREGFRTISEHLPETFTKPPSHEEKNP